MQVVQVVTYNALVGYELEKARKSMGLDQSYIAKKTGISQPVLSRLEKGKASISVDQLFLICTALEQTPQDVLGRVFQSLNAIQREISVQVMTSKEVNTAVETPLSGPALGAVLTLLLSRE